MRCQCGNFLRQTIINRGGKRFYQCVGALTGMEIPGFDYPNRTYSCGRKYNDGGEEIEKGLVTEFFTGGKLVVERV